VLTLTLSVEEAQAVLDALVLRPYVEVAEVIAKIQQQAAEQMSDGSPHA